ncbi:MAG: hypothetical protein ABSD21_04690 [Rhizomicrobium sp.]
MDYGIALWKALSDAREDELVAASESTAAAQFAQHEQEVEKRHAKEVAALGAQSQPLAAKRMLNKDQMKAIEDILAEYPVGYVQIIPVWSKPEVVSFASQLEDIVDKVKGGRPDDGVRMLPPLDRVGFPSGVMIQHAPGSDAGFKFSTELARLLRADGIEANAVAGTPNWTGPGVVIMIGEIP